MLVLQRAKASGVRVLPAVDVGQRAGVNTLRVVGVAIRASVHITSSIVCINHVYRVSVVTFDVQSIRPARHRSKRCTHRGTNGLKVYAGEFINGTSAQNKPFNAINS